MCWTCKVLRERIPPPLLGRVDYLLSLALFLSTLLLTRFRGPMMHLPAAEATVSPANFRGHPPVALDRDASGTNDPAPQDPPVLFVSLLIEPTFAPGY